MLEKLYLCGINNNTFSLSIPSSSVVICLKNCTFVVSTTTVCSTCLCFVALWFAWKIVPLWYQQQLDLPNSLSPVSCDLLEKLYLCGINNNNEKSFTHLISVVICLKNCTFVVSTTTITYFLDDWRQLWFAWKIVPLWYQQQQHIEDWVVTLSCDLLEKLYLCGINNN